MYRQVKMNKTKQAFENGIKKWADKEQVNPELKALADIKAVIMKMYKQDNYSININECLDEIEEILDTALGIDDKIQILLEIRKLISKVYERIGRQQGFDGSFEDYKFDCIKEIEKILMKVQIPNNYLIISKLKYEDFFENG